MLPKINYLSEALPANHGKPWDGKVMGTKVSYERANAADTMSARLLENTAPRPKGRSAKQGS